MATLALAVLLVGGLWIALAGQGTASVRIAWPTAVQVQHALGPTDSTTNRVSFQRLAVAAGREASDPDLAQTVNHLAGLCHQDVPTTSTQFMNAWEYNRAHGHPDEDLFEFLSGIDMAVGQARTGGVAGMFCVNTGAAVVNLMGGAP